MIDLLLETLGFALKSGTVVLAIAAITAIIASLTSRQRGPTQGYLELRRLNGMLRSLGRQVRHAGLRGKAMKAARKVDKQADKAEHKSVQAGQLSQDSDDDATDDKEATHNPKKRIFVLNFDGDVRARRVEQLREEITAIVAGARDSDEVLLRLSSPGGAVTGYGLAASQLARLAQRKIPLTVAIDQVAASGGYMMACVADRIIAAPFAVVGSIGVVATVPNVRKLLVRQGVDVEQVTAGAHKRTLSMFGENTEEGRAHFQADLNDMHLQFKEHVARHRPQVDVEQVATGAHWTANRAVGLGLVDELLTSDDWLLARHEAHDLIEVTWRPPQTVGRRFGLGVESTLVHAAERLWSRISNQHRF